MMPVHFGLQSNDPRRRLARLGGLARLGLVLALVGSVAAAREANSAAHGGVPQDVEQLWADVDPCKYPLEVEVVREWEEDAGVYRYVVYTIGTFKDVKARMAGFYGFPKGGLFVHRSESLDRHANPWRTCHDRVDP